MFEIAQPFLLSLALGLMIGIERERAFAENGRYLPFGARTFTLIALLGTLAAHLDRGVAFILAAFVATIAVAAYLRPPVEGRAHAGTTTEVAAVITFGLGWLAHGEPKLAAMLGVVVVLVLWLKAKIHAFAHGGLNDQEVKAALTFLVIALVVLPLLPNRTVDPWEIANPSKLWLMFVLIAGVGFAGYIAVRALGPTRGLAVAGFFAGLVSSTAATLSLSRRAVSQESFAGPLATGIVLANVASAMSQLLLVVMADPHLARAACFVLGMPILVGVAGTLAATQFLARRGQSSPDPEFQLANPLELEPAVFMAVGFAVALIVSAMAERWLGGSGVILTAAIAGTSSAHAPSLAAATLSASGRLAPGSALTAILAAFLANMAVKIAIVAVVGGRRLFFAVAAPLVAMAASAAAMMALINRSL